MEFSTLVIALFSIALAYFVFFKLDSKRRSGSKLPPGPYPLPIVGNLFQLGPKPHQSLAQLAKTHGPLMSLHLGSLHTVVVTSPQMAKEIFVKNGHQFLNRIVAEAAHAHDHHKISMGFLDAGSEWRALRRICKEEMFSTQSLDSSQGMRREKLQQLRDYVQRCCDQGRVVEIHEASFVTMLNLMSATLFSIQAAEFDSDAAEEFREIIEGVTNVFGDPNFADYFPILKRFDLQGVKRKAELYMGKLLVLVENLLEKRQEERRKSPDYVRKNDLLEKLVDILMEESGFKLTNNHISHLLLDLLVGGSETTTTAVEWIMSELLINPEKLEKTKDELRRVVGEGKQVQEADMPRLPYSAAVIKEVLRLHPPGPLLFPRKAESEVEVGGYTIPKDTQIFVNVWAMGRDPSIWPNPEAFEPERFIDNKIDYNGHNFELIPFGSGRRMCPGLTFSNRMLPMTVATLIHNFNWKLQVEANAQDVHKAEVFGTVVRRAVPLKAYPINL